MKKTINARFITVAAVMLAMNMVAPVIPFVPIFFLPTMIAATLLGLKMTLFVSVSFGLVSVIYSFILPTTIVGLAFQHAPYLAIVPRIVAALGAYIVFIALSKGLEQTNLNKNLKAVLPISIAAATGSILNTALVVSGFIIIVPDVYFGGITILLALPTMLISGLIEFILLAVITPPIVITLKKVMGVRFLSQISPSLYKIDYDFNDDLVYNED